MLQPLLAVLLLASPAAAGDGMPLVEALFSPDAATRTDARQKLIERGDRSLAPALVEAVFFAGAGRRDAATVLEKLLGESHGTTYKEWVEAIGRRVEIVPAPGYLAFKARQYSRIDPAFSDLLVEGPRTIRPEEIIFGGVKKDGIPALRNPRKVPAGEASHLKADEIVFGISVGGKTRAYPRRILDWHEMANDVVDGRTVTLSYCTLCGSAVLFETTLAEGETYTFGSSGLLYRSNKLMYDHQTGSLWSNLTGEPVMGPLAAKGKRLPLLPVTVTTWGEWRTRHPGTDVLSLDTGYERDYKPGAAYGRYFESPDLMFPVWKRSDRLKAKSWVHVVEAEGVRKAYPLEALVKRPLLHDSVGATTVVLLTDPASEAVRAYRADGRRFRAEGGVLTDDANGVRFRQEEEALVCECEAKTRLARLPGHRAYWFGWYAFYPGAEVYAPP